jgi:hypothetical protein
VKVQEGGVAFCKHAGLAHVGLVINCCVCANNLCVKGGVINPDRCVRRKLLILPSV